MILGIDTSSMVCAGIARGDWLLASGSVRDSRAHVEQLMPLVQRVLDDAHATMADLTGIAVGVGPGPFTGLRVGVVAAATLGEALGIGVRGYCSLDVIASQVVADERAEGEFLVASDARRKEWYWATYAPDGTRLTGPFVGAPQSLPELPRFGSVTDNPLDLDAGQLAAAADRLVEVGMEPLYLRRPDAEVSTRVKSTLLPPRLVPRSNR